MDYTTSHLGECLQTWTPDVLVSKLGDCRVSVHVAKESNLNFINRNFQYEYMTISELLYRIKASQQSINAATDGVEYFYYRALGQRPRKDPATLSAVHPFLQETFSLPPAITDLTLGDDALYDIHSTVFRISQSGVELWTHYDALDNFLVQIRGSKRIILFPPTELHKLAITDTSSPYQGISNVDEQRNNPALQSAYKNALEAKMDPGDVLFIPAAWSHAVKSLQKETLILPDICISVNTFLQSRTHVHGVKNVYGNEDPLAMKKACDLMKGEIEKLARSLPLHLQPAFWSKLASIALSHLK
ncbi:bifunctional tRNA wybutosine-synthesizing protein 5/Cupin-like domain 8/JmjC domain [Babesia duncani]|uniref:Bifunctional tRNA wybutosine-synthesizing protein 5/Cupin-like domain 8/JmjC domain n=1 Tax=Babesia duncani TaxID=323732 RepID=A0AAD9UPL8_9APIC|nr:bifunctional tRNA wybutosine-synthesizing protein 5/Cupin-like domain 8/JmjC domain [Babesia duncani]